jgi:hypothetical protein
MSSGVELILTGMCEAGGRIVLPDDARNKDELTSAL